MLFSTFQQLARLFVTRITASAWAHSKNQFATFVTRRSSCSFRSSWSKFRSDNSGCPTFSAVRGPCSPVWPGKGCRCFCPGGYVCGWRSRTSCDLPRRWTASTRCSFCGGGCCGPVRRCVGGGNRSDALLLKITLIHIQSFAVDQILDFSREYRVQYFQHLLPELVLALQICCYVVLGSLGNSGVSDALEPDVGPAVADWPCIDIYLGLFGLELFRVEDVVYGAGVVDRRVLHFVCIVVHFLVLLQHIVAGFGKGNVLLIFEVIENILGCYVLMSDLQGYHYKWNISFHPQHICTGMRVKEYVELCGWGDIAFAYGSTHYHYFLYFLFQLWICQEQYRQIGQRPGVNPYNFALPRADLLKYFLKSLLPLGFFRRCRQLDSPKAIAAVHVLGQFHLSLDQLIGTRNNRDIAPANIIQNVKCILSGIVEVGIAG